jgi:uncharacterized phage protein gp47/JayE
MPFPRPTLTDLRTQTSQDIASALPGTDPLLRFANLGIIGRVLAGLINLLYGYLDWIAQQSVPFTAVDEYLEGWGALVNVFRNPATRAIGTVSFTGAPDGTTLPNGTQLTRGDGKTFRTTASANVVSGVVTAPARADADASGLTGAWGNCDAGTVFVIGQAVAGINSSGSAATAFTGGADLETNDSYRERVLSAYQKQPQGGDPDDFYTWARNVPGVTRAWVAPNLAGAGTVTVYFMMDVTESAHNGFPQGTNGVSANDKGPTGTPRDVVATGDQLAVANAICAVAPVTALVYAVAPTPSTVNFVLDGIAGVSSTTKTAISTAIDTVFLQHSNVTGGATTLDISFLESAIAAVPGTEGFVMTSPSTNIALGAGALPVRGTTTYT